MPLRSGAAGIIGFGCAAPAMRWRHAGSHCGRRRQACGRTGDGAGRLSARCTGLAPAGKKRRHLGDQGAGSADMGPDFGPQGAHLGGVAAGCEGVVIAGLPAAAARGQSLLKPLRQAGLFRNPKSRNRFRVFGCKPLDVLDDLPTPAGAQAGIKGTGRRKGGTAGCPAGGGRHAGGGRGAGPADRRSGFKLDVTQSSLHAPYFGT